LPGGHEVAHSEGCGTQSTLGGLLTHLSLSIFMLIEVDTIALVASGLW